MKRLLVLLPTIVLTGCLATAPQSQLKFPAVPDELKQACPALKQIDPNTTELSDVVSVVSDNYGQYKDCKARVDAWIDWYNQHQQIWDNR
jgi:hypothetical protein